MPTRIRTAALAGIDGVPVHVEVDISRGLPGFHLVGLPATEVRESRDRVLAALRHSGLRPPPGRITVNLAPAEVRKTGAAFDLAIALGVLAAAGQAPPWPHGGGEALCLGELSLFGEVRPVRGVLAMALAAAQAGCRRALVPAGQADEAAAAGLQAVGVGSLAEAVRWWRTGAGGTPAAAAEGSDEALARRQAERLRACRRLAALRGQSLLRKAAVIAAVGRHNLLLSGPPGTGKTRLARLLAHLQPDPDPREALTTTRIHSAAGLLASREVLVQRPFRAPHHTITRAGLVGGGAGLKPGEVTLAHGGLLFLDELAEFRPDVLDVLREPLQEGRINVARGAGSRSYPASFQLVAALNPCRCGFLGSPDRPCRCTAAERARYRGRISGPLLDRFELFVEVGAWEGEFAAGEVAAAEPAPDADWREAITPAGLIAARSRLLAAPRGPSLAIEARDTLEQARRSMGLSLRGTVRCRRVAATVAALDGATRVTAAHVREALEFRRDALPWG